ncbi:MAG: M20/M25/M40 family metallo-hydrolase [Bacillota bacterium]|nr:M20/M25/M40 family metallo-hydrolase [Bacillota bacterium]
MNWNEIVDKVAGRPEVQAAFRRIDGMLEEFAAETTAICEVPAPPFKEHARAEFVADLMRRYGLGEVHVDEAPNPIGVFPAAGGAKGNAVMLAAHIDTVFPEGTDCTVRREGNTLIAPGVSDNSANVAAILAVARLLREFHFELPREVVFVGTAGEEGLGDLRGMKVAMRALKDRVARILPVDGGFGTICHRAVGSRRLKVTAHTVGGHSYGDFGRPSAIHGLGRMIAGIAVLTVPKSPKTTFNVGVISGGTSVNTIAPKAWMQVDMRSESAAELAKLEENVRAAIGAGAEAEGTEYTIEVVGDRAAGQTPAEADLIKLLTAVFEQMGITPVLRSGSTDSNVPIGMGLEAATISAKNGTGGHTVNDAVYVESMIPGVKTLLLTVLVAAGWGQ